MSRDAGLVLILHGRLFVSVGVSTGYVPLGGKPLVTKAEGAVIYEIDNRPATDLYANYLQQPSVYHPFAVQDETRKSPILSTPLNFDADTGALLVVNPVAESSTF